MEAEHLLFFDDECPFCVRAVRHVVEIDQDHKFLFAPLRGETAQEILSGPQASLRHANSLVVVESWRSTDRCFWVRSRAVFRIYWLVGGQWTIYGWLSFLPGFFGDWFYNLFAAHRHQFRLRHDKEVASKDRFLP